MANVLVTLGDELDRLDEVYKPKCGDKRAAYLDRAKGIVCKDRESQYGNPEDNFKLIADLWSVYTGYPISATDVAMMMALLKAARIKTGVFKEDSFIDLIGYGACAGEIAYRENADQAKGTGKND